MDSTGSHESHARFSFQCISNEYQTVHFQSHTHHLTTALPPSLLLPALLPGGTPAIWEMNSPDSCHTAQNYNLPFGKSASGSIVFPEIELAHQQTLNNSSCPPPAWPSPPPLCLSQVLLRCGSSRSRMLPFKMLTKEAHLKLEGHFILHSC